MYQSIAMDEFYQKEKREKLNVLDVRETDEFRNGHIKGAKSLPLSAIQENASSLQTDKDYYVICHSGARSARASEYLARQGFKVTNVMGGMSAWKGDVDRGNL